MKKELTNLSMAWLVICALLMFFVASLPMLELLALIATITQVYATLPSQTTAVISFLWLTFKTAFCFTMLEFLGLEKCQAFYESEISGLLKLRFCNCLQSVLHATNHADVYSCTEDHVCKFGETYESRGHHFGSSPPQTRCWQLRRSLNALASSAGRGGVKVLYDQSGDFASSCCIETYKQFNVLLATNDLFKLCFTPNSLELNTIQVRVSEKGLMLEGAWFLCTSEQLFLFRDVDGGSSQCLVKTKTGKALYKKKFSSRLSEIEYVLEGLLTVIKTENFGLVSSSWHILGLNILHSSSFDELFEYILSGRRVSVAKFPAGCPTLVLGNKSELSFQSLSMQHSLMGRREMH